MNSSTTVYNRRPLTGPIPSFSERIREWSDVELEARADTIFDAWAEYTARGDAESAAYLHAYLEDVAVERQRRVDLRDHHSDNPHTPVWTDSKARNYGHLKDLAEYLKQRWPIERFMSDMMAVTLVPAGGDRMKGLCVFHHERTPSMTVYSAGHFHCFGCGAHGDIFDAVGQYFVLDSFREQIDKLASATPDVPSKLTRRQARTVRKHEGMRVQGGKVVAA